MNCLILVLLLLCGQNNGNWFDNGCNNGCGCRNDRCDREGRGERDGGRSGGCGCGNDRKDEDDCGCRNDFRSEPRFEQRPFMFNQNPGCGCEEQQNNNCDR